MQINAELDPAAAQMQIGAAAAHASLEAVPILVDGGNPIVLCTSECMYPVILLRNPTYSDSLAVWQSAVCSLQMGTHNANDVCQQQSP